jgi:hypothetical protein
MTAPADAPNIITRKDWALFVKDETGQPNAKLIQDLEDQQTFLTTAIPADVAAAQATADAAVLAAAAAQATATTANATANAAAAKLAGDSFLSVVAEATLPTGRTLAVSGTGIQKVDGGAGRGVDDQPNGPKCNTCGGRVRLYGRVRQRNRATRRARNQQYVYGGRVANVSVGRAHNGARAGVDATRGRDDQRRV